MKTEDDEFEFDDALGDLDENALQMLDAISANISIPANAPGSAVHKVRGPVFFGDFTNVHLYRLNKLALIIHLIVLNLSPIERLTYQLHRELLLMGTTGALSMVNSRIDPLMRKLV
jgi:hypothetical protein